MMVRKKGKSDLFFSVPWLALYLFCIAGKNEVGTRKGSTKGKIGIVHLGNGISQLLL